MEEPQLQVEPPVPIAPPTSGKAWMAVVVAVVTFLAGIAIGFLGRPAIVPDAVVVVTATPDATAVANAQATPTSAGQGDIMDLVLADARHSQGDLDAPVTIVEFSDFK